MKHDSFFIVLLLLLLQGCVPYVNQFNYISLVDVPDIQVLEYGKYEPGKTFSHEEMPVKYELPRASYKLYFEIDSYSAGKVLMVWSKSSSDDPLDVRAVDVEGSCGGFRSYRSKNEYWNAVRAKYYSWGAKTRNCTSEGSSYQLDVDQKYRVIAFEVLDGGIVLGKEVIPFKWVNNGYYVHSDSL